MLHLQTHSTGSGLQGLSSGQDRPLVVRAPCRAKCSRLATQVYVPDTTAVSTSGTAQEGPDASARALLLQGRH